MSNIINYDTRLRYLFEPFHPLHVDCSKRLRLYHYIRPTENPAFFLDVARPILTGRVRGEWVDRFTPPGQYRQRLIKDCMAHLFLKWIKTKFPSIRIVLLMRHPCAVVASRRILDTWTWLEDPRELLQQEALVEDHLNPFRDEILSTLTFIERRIMIWAIIHYIVLHQFQPGEVHLSFYENFCTQPLEESRRLFEFLGESPDEESHALDYAFRNPSDTTQEHSAITAGADLLDGWTRKLSAEERRRAIEILGVFGLDEIYGEGLLPNTGAAYEMLRRP